MKGLNVPIPLEQGSVFRRAEDLDHSRPQTSQSLWNRAVSFDNQKITGIGIAGKSQSLWNRAVSFDTERKPSEFFINSLNPFGTGQCLSTRMIKPIKPEEFCLNPFGTGQCLSTRVWRLVRWRIVVSIPLEQGSVFRLKKLLMVFAINQRLNPFGTGQCLPTG